MKQQQLNKILEKHKLFLQGKDGGKRADLQGANLKGAYLQMANLEGTNLGEANLKGTNLKQANLESIKRRFSRYT